MQACGLLASEYSKWAMKGQCVTVVLALGLRKVNWKRWEKNLAAK
jgi:hypothetical protein